jgi:D-inositol-3-phosphate glycosyltransferase
MKVTHLVTFFEPAYAGGIQRYVGEIARWQRQAGVDASVLTVTLPARRRPAVPASTAAEWNLENRGLPITTRSAWGIFYRTPFCLALLADLRGLAGEIVHLHAPSPWLEFALSLVRPKTSLVLTVHNGYPGTTMAERWLSRRAGALLRSTMAAASAIIVPSQAFLKEIAPDRVLSNRINRIHVVPPGINHSRFYPLNLPRDERLILFVGHLRREKGLHILIEALTHMPDCRLQVLASVSYESQYFQNVRKLAREKLGERVNFVLNPDYNTLLQAYNKAACVVVPSTGLESWNLVLLEAAVCGTACVRSTLPSLAWADFAGVAPPGDALALAAAVRGALEHRTALEMAAVRAARDYSWERTATQTTAVYEDILT